VSRTDHYVGINHRAEQLIQGAEAHQYDTFDGAFMNRFPLMQYVLPDGTNYFEFVQADPWASGPHFFLALKDENDSIVDGSLWFDDEVENLI
jgi:hypothetical protein